MGLNKSVQEQIDDNVRFCEELLGRDPHFVPKGSEPDLDGIFPGMPDETPAGRPPEPGIRTIPVAQPQPGSMPGAGIRPTPAAQPQPGSMPGAGIRPTPAAQPQPGSMPGAGIPSTPAAQQTAPGPGIKTIPVAQPGIAPEVNQKTASNTKIVLEPAEELKISLKAKEEPEKKTSSKKSAVIHVLICVIIALAAGFLITKFVANHTTVEGSSMEPTLQSGDNLIVEQVSYLTGKPQRFDIIVFEHSTGANYIKRVIGLPGERVQIQEGKIYINDNAIYDAHGNTSQFDAGIAAETITLGNDEYFVLGDNRNSSEDSRNENVGPVKADKILGKAWLRVTPFDHFGFLE